MNDQLKSWLRHILTGAGGILIMKGWTDAPGLESIIGMVMALAGFVWSWLHHSAKKA